MASPVPFQLLVGPTIFYGTSIYRFDQKKNNLQRDPHFATLQCLISLPVWFVTSTRPLSHSAPSVDGLLLCASFLGCV